MYILGTAVTGASDISTDLVSSNQITDYSFVSQPFTLDPLIQFFVVFLDWDLLVLIVIPYWVDGTLMELSCLYLLLVQVVNFHLNQ